MTKGLLNYFALCIKNSMFYVLKGFDIIIIGNNIAVGLK